MKRSLQLTLILACAILCAALSACALTPEQKAAISTNAIKNGDAFVLGYLTGGKAGALAGLSAQEIANIKERQKTAPKNPPSRSIAP